MRRFILVLFIVGFSTQVNAKDAIIESGFDAYKKIGSPEAWTAWAKGGPMEGSKDIAASAAQFGQIEAYYGKYVGHDYVLEKKLSDTNKIVYVILNLESGPLFGRFYLYKKSNGNWVVPNFNFHTHAEQVWPPSIYAGCGD